MRRWVLVAVVVFTVLDLVVLAVAYRARAGVLPPWQVEQPRFSEPPASEATASASPTGPISGPVMLAVDASGLVLRATRGACEPRFNSTAQVAVGQVRSGEGLASVEVPDVVEVLGIAVLPGGHLRVAGLDAGCQPVYQDSTDGGQSWKRLAAAGIWRLDRDTTALSVTGPSFGEPAPLDCVPHQLVNMPDLRALVSCDSGSFYVLTPTGKPLPRAAGGFTSLSAAAGTRPGDFYVLGTTEACLAQLGDVLSGRQSVVNRACFSAKDNPPLGIASAGNLVVVQVGDQLAASEDGGRTFDTVG